MYQEEVHMNPDEKVMKAVAITDRKIEALQKMLPYIRLAIIPSEDKSENYIANHLYYLVTDIFHNVERLDRIEAKEKRDKANGHS